MAHCIMNNANAVFKICECGWDYARYRAVIVEGKAERMTKHEDILQAVRSIAKQRKLNEDAFDNIAQHVTDSPESNSVRIEIENIGGVMA